MRSVGKPKRGSLGQLFLSCYNSKRGFVSRELIPLVISSWGKRDDIQIIEHTKTQFKGCGNKLLVRKVQLSRKMRLKEIANTIDQKYVKKTNRFLIGIQMDLHGRRKNWVNPILFTAFNELQEVRSHRKMLENNGAIESQIRFWRKLETLQEASFINLGISSHATVSLLESEIKNFARGFDIRV